MRYVLLLLCFIAPTLSFAGLCDDILSLRYRSFKATVTKIYDGDTIKAHFGGGESYKIRLIGMDAPESYYKGFSQGDLGEISKQYLQNLLQIGDKVLVRTEYETIDQYGRILGYVYKNDIDIGLEMVRAGMAINYIIDPNVGRAIEYSKAADHALSNKAGLLKDGFIEPYLWRRQVKGLGITRYIKDIRDGTIYRPIDYEKVPFQFRIFLGEGKPK